MTMKEILSILRLHMPKQTIRVYFEQHRDEGQCDDKTDYSAGCDQYSVNHRRLDAIVRQDTIN